MVNSFAGTGPAHAQSSLPSLPAHLQSDTHLTAHLASRFHVGLPTARLSSQALIALNTYSSATKGPDGGKEGSAAGEAEDLARRAFTRLGARAENQAVVFLGESGSGKTTLRSHLLSSFLSFSSTPLSSKISYAAFIFDTLTTTKSVTTPTASKAGLFLELQYDGSSSVNPTLIGGKIIDYRLERSRISSVPTGERSFHVLYYLLAGTSAAEKSHLGFENSIHVQTGSRFPGGTVSHKRWRYLGHPTQLKVGINDTEGFQHFKTALRKLEFSRGEIAEICQILASILHIGQLEFITGQSTTTSAEESGGYSHEGGETVTVVKNKEVLDNVAAFLGLSVEALETSLGYRTKTIHRERVTVILDPKGARENADAFARTIYSLLVTYVIETVNQRLCAAEDSVANTISIVDFPGFAQAPSTGSTLDQLLSNAATETLYHYCLQSFFDHKADLLDREEITVAATSYFDNTDTVRGLLKHGNGLLSILDDQTRRGRSDAQFLDSVRKRFENKNPAISVGGATGSGYMAQPRSAFTVKHFAGEVDYSTTGLLEENGEVISGDLMNLMRSTRSEFVRELFNQEALNTISHPQEKTAIMQAQVSSKPLRMPSMARRKTGPPSRVAAPSTYVESEDGDDHETQTVGSKRVSGRKSGIPSGPAQGAAGQFLSGLTIINKSLSSSNLNPYFVICLKPNDRRIANQFDSKCVRMQVQTFGIAEISSRLRNADYSVFLPFGEFLGLADIGNVVVGSDREKSEVVLDEKRWPGNEARVGSTGVFLSERCWADMAKVGERVVPSYGSPDETDGFQTAGVTPDSKLRLLSPADQSPGAFIYGDDSKQGYFGSRELDGRSDAGGSAFNSGDLFKNLDTKEQMLEKNNEKKMEEVDEAPTSGSRRRWMFLVYLLTFFIPDFVIRFVGRMKRKDVRTAWREKLAINMIIWFACGVAVFMIVGFPGVVCPTQAVYNTAELSGKNGNGKAESYVAIRGVVFNLGSFIPYHYPDVVPDKSLKAYAGTDATNLFPVQVSALCQGRTGKVDPSVPLDYRSNLNDSAATTSSSTFDINAKYHDFRSWTNDSRADWFYEQMVPMRANYKKGYMGYTAKAIKKLATDDSRKVASINGKVYDMTYYLAGPRIPRWPAGKNGTSDVDTDYMEPLLVDIFERKAGSDVTKYWEDLNFDAQLRSRMQLCLDNLFFIGKVDTRDSVRCQFARYFILAISIMLCSIITFKFLAALQFGKKNLPENLDKFIICQVPVYTEDEESLRRAMDSMARMRYDDKRKLLLVICDGMIIGQGNDRPTPRIVLDILGVPESVDPEPLSFESLGEGMKQHNMAKLYSGLYEVQGHIVPFLVVVKVGKPSEVSRPGNRGKRDSQLVLMRFLNRVHYNLPMSPMELEMHHHIRNIIGVNPQFYEYILQVDADTMVAPDAATRFVSSFLSDTRLIGCCGETSLSNAKTSIITMIQVYEYYISHNLTKAFESLFGSVTCLPGCFSMYRIRTAENGTPLFVSKAVVDSYAEIRVDTLHMKNLLHLGEDRYLTTLLLKHHPKFKTKYIFRCHAWTVAPESFAVFLSQRRRWINSTVHNLMELIPLQQLCGFCCFSMRFIVLIDLLMTVIQPVTVAYIAYLIYWCVSEPDVLPITSFILLGVIYGLQAFIFIVRRKWEMIGWMLIYLLSIPIFSLALPLYSFWHMDDFSWGNTRVITGEKGRKVVISDEGKFDPDSIPKKIWEDYQAELWESQTSRDDRSEFSAHSYGTRIPPFPQSEYGYQSASRPVSQLDLPLGGGGTRYSVAPSEMMSNFGMEDLSHLPPDDEILEEIRKILATADLMKVSKKTVKQELERHFEVNLDAKRPYINSATEAILSGVL
ncbi:Fungal chitin synthase [Penicillium bovifimosum]|uniref:chitin synthase n=1 Tax=Penicillium bovifimosum TaxID=126998 RepID=A0A9W9GTP3_9EURO|nr:Fungal chitin synthase [Penicillium bovifimosum]KAJ5129772.1 Fungal chitin synthase [Penicillium bovifimosum]